MASCPVFALCLSLEIGPRKPSGVTTHSSPISVIMMRETARNHDADRTGRCEFNRDSPSWTSTRISIRVRLVRLTQVDAHERTAVPHEDLMTGPSRTGTRACKIGLRMLSLLCGGA